MDDPLEVIESLQQEKLELESQMKKLEEGAVQIIMEKDQRISELEDQLQQLQIDGWPQKIALIEEQYHAELQNKIEEISKLKQLISELQEKYHQENNTFQDHIAQLEQELNIRMLDTLQLQSSEAKANENYLIHQITERDEKIKHFEKTLFEQNHTIDELKQQVEKDVYEHEQQIKELQKQLRAALDKSLKQEKAIEDVYKNQAALRQEKNEEINKITKIKEEFLRSNVKLEKDIRRAQEQINVLNRENEQYEKDLKAFKDKMMIETLLNQERLVEMEKKSKMEKLQLEHELSKYREDSKSHEENNNDETNSLFHEMGLIEEQAVNVQGFNDEHKHEEFKEQIEPEYPPIPSHQREKDDYFISSKRTKITNIDAQSPQIIRIMVNDTDNLKEENVLLREVLIQIKLDNENLKNEIQIFEKTIELLQTEIKNTQRLSNHADCFDKEKTLTADLEKYKSHSYVLETHMITCKQQWAEEQNFLKEELKYADNALLEAKTLLAQTVVEKEYFQSQMRNLQNKIKQSKLQNKIESIPKIPSIKETDYCSEQEHMEMVQKAMKQQQEAKKQNDVKQEKKSSRTGLLSYFIG